MSARIPPGYAEFWVRYDLSADPEPAYWSIGLDIDLGASAAPTIADAVDNVIAPAMDAFLASEWTVGGGHLIVGQDGGDLRYDCTTSPQTGDGTSGAPQNCAVLVRKLTALGGRRGQGRAYIPGVPETSVTARGDLDSTYRTTLQTALNSMIGAVNTVAGVDAVVLLHNSAPFTPTPITDLVVQPRIATQRRRLRP